MGEQQEVKQKHAGGRPTKYRPEYCQKILEYFEIDPIQFKDIIITYKDGSTKECTEEEAAPLPTFRKFAKSIGTYHDVLLDWCKKFPEFATAYNRAKEAQLEFIMENGLRGNFQGYFAGLYMKNMHGWRDKTEQEISGSVKVVAMGSITVDSQPLKIRIGDGQD